MRERQGAQRRQRRRWRWWWWRWRVQKVAAEWQAAKEESGPRKKQKNKGNAGGTE